MKCTTVIDPDREEEILIYLKQEDPISQKIEELARGEPFELIGYLDKSIVKLEPKNVFCFIVEDNKVFAVTEHEKLQLRLRLYVLEENLSADFVKINQSCIANIKKIQKFDVSLGGSLLVTFQNGYRDYVSRRQLKTVKERIGFKL